MITHTIAIRVSRFLEKAGYLVRDAESEYLDLMQDKEDAMGAIVGASITYRLALFAEILKQIGGSADDFDAFVWQPYRGSVDFTYLWAGYYENLEALANSWQAITDSGMEDDIDALWGELETCRSALTTAELIYDSPDHPSSPTSSNSKGMLESFRCTLQPEKSLSEVRDVLEDWHGHAQDLGLPFDVFMRTPIVSGSEITHSYFVTHADAAAYGRNMSAWRNHPGTAAIDAKLAEVQSCTNALWQSWQVISSD